MNYSIFAISENGTQTVDFADSKIEAEEKVKALNTELKNGNYQDKTDLENIQSFDFDMLG